MTTTLRRFQLRERTAAAHAAVDAAIGGFDSIDTYKRYLASLYGFRAPLEAGLEADCSAMLGPWRPASIAGALRADMADLGVPIPALCPVDLPVNRDGLLGTLYVLEGASLGARLLLRRAEALGLTPIHGARHLALQAARSGEWRAFLDILEADDNFDIEHAASASLAAFAVAASAFGAR